MRWSASYRPALGGARMGASHMTASPDVLVIGAGAVGLACAYELTRGGARVHVLDSGPRPGLGASLTNAGLLVPSHVDPLPSWRNIRAGLTSMTTGSGFFQLSMHASLAPWMARFIYYAGAPRHRVAGEHLRALARRSFDLHAEYADAGLRTGFTRLGMLDIFHNRASFQRAATDRSSPATSRVVLTAAEVNTYLPSVRKSGAAGGVLFEKEGLCDPTLLCKALAQECQLMGVRFSYGCRVTGLLQDGSRVIGVDTEDVTHTGGQVVLAAGIWSRALAATVGVRIPLESGTGYILDFDKAPDDPSIPIAFADQRMVATPYPDRLRITGMMLLTGPRPTLEAKRVHALRQDAARMMASLESRHVQRVQLGQRPCTPDGLPIIGAANHRPGLILATGHGQSGIILAPVTGQMVHHQVNGAASAIDDNITAACSPDRFWPGAKSLT